MLLLLYNCYYICGIFLTYQQKLTRRHVTHNSRNIIFIIPPAPDGYPKISHTFSRFFICNEIHM
jgi:hypothetical protein